MYKLILLLILLPILVNSQNVSKDTINYNNVPITSTETPIKKEVLVNSTYWNIYFNTIRANKYFIPVGKPVDKSNLATSTPAGTEAVNKMSSTLNEIRSSNTTNLTMRTVYVVKSNYTNSTTYFITK